MKKIVNDADGGTEKSVAFEALPPSQKEIDKSLSCKKVLFVINTMGRAGAEKSLLELLKRFDRQNYLVDLFILTGQGELIAEIPEGVRLLNKDPDPSPVLTDSGKRLLAKRLLKRHRSICYLLKGLPYLIEHGIRMLIKGRLLPDKLFWRYISDSADRLEVHYDLAVAFLEGGSAYYVAEHVSADRKAAFIHIDYIRSGYYRGLDRDCYLAFNNLYAVSEDVKRVFLDSYPELADRTEIFYNIVDRDAILVKSREGAGFSDGFTGLRILSVGRLTAQKNYPVSIEAMTLLKKRGFRLRWYVLGEGEDRPRLEALIREKGLLEDFILAGAVDNPYPYIRNCHIFVHATEYEGKSIAVEEARVLGRAIVISDTSGNHDQITDGVDGLYCAVRSDDICEKIIRLVTDQRLRSALEDASSDRYREHMFEHEKLMRLLT